MILYERQLIFHVNASKNPFVRIELRRALISGLEIARIETKSLEILRSGVEKPFYMIIKERQLIFHVDASKKPFVRIELR